MAVAIEGMPLTNTAGKSIVGACPLCAGNTDAESGLTHADGHARVCWDPDVALSSATMQKGCSNGQRAVLCVYDRGNIRNQTRDDLASASAGSVVSSTSSTLAPLTSINNGNDNGNSNGVIIPIFELNLYQITKNIATMNMTQNI
jgi:hypothetical protein